jgi:hypothetical protein
MTWANLAIHHANTLVCNLKPDLAAQTNDQPDVILRPGRVTSIRNELAIGGQKGGSVYTWRADDLREKPVEGCKDEHKLMVGRERSAAGDNYPGNFRLCLVS